MSMGPERIFQADAEALALVGLPLLEIIDSRNASDGSKDTAVEQDLFHWLKCAIDDSSRKRIIDELSDFGISHYPEKQPFLFFHRLQVNGLQVALVRRPRNQEDIRGDRYRRLVLDHAAGVFRCDLAGTILECNQAFCRMLGYPDPDSMLGLDMRVFHHTADDWELVIKRLREKGELVKTETRLRRKDGEEVICQENLYIHKEEDGSESVSGSTMDITNQKIFEKSMKESEERLAALAAVAHEAVVFLEGDLVVDCNEQFAALFGYLHSSEVMGMSITEFITSVDMRRLSMGMEISRANKMEIRSSTRDAKLLVLEVSGIDMKIRNQSRRILVLTDVTARKRAEFALEQTVHRLRNVLESAPNAIVIITGGRIEYVNQASVDLLLAKDEDDLCDKDFMDFIFSEYVAEVSDDLEQVAQGKEVGYKELSMRRLDGSTVEVGMRATLTVFENKLSLQISLTDISTRVQLLQEQMRTRIAEEINLVLKQEIEEHKQTQTKLREQEKYTRSLIDSSMDMIIACDGSFRIKEFNKAAEYQFRRSLSDVIGKDIDVLFASGQEVSTMKEIVLSKGEVLVEMVNVRRGGEEFNGLVSISRIRDTNDQGFIAILRDITEFRAHERRALEQKAKLESIFNSTENLMMWTMDRNYRLTTSNANFRRWVMSELGRNLDQTIDVLALIQEHVDKDTYQSQLDAFRLSFDGRPQQFELAMRPQPDGLIWLEFFINPIYVGDKLEEVSCLVYNTTSRKRIERQIREALREKEVLLQEVHHRVKNNLQVISSILNLQSSFVSDKKTLDILEESQNRIKSMSFIHETLYRTTDFSSIQFSDYLRTLSYNLIQSYRLRSYTVDFHPSLDDVSIHIDQAIPCGLIVNELVSNSLKYAFSDRREGNLYLDLHEENGILHLRVADDGIGLPVGFQYDKTDSLGVQLVYTLTEQLDGQIRVTSEPGNGTEFLITFELSRR
ncbi:MAG: PAS domain S-box protein [Flavobacteriales bacterium]